MEAAIQHITHVRGPIAGAFPVATWEQFALVQAAGRLVAVDMTKRRLAWEVELPEERWRAGLTRHISTFSSYAPQVDAGRRVIACLTHEAYGGLRLHGHDLQTGAARWMTEIPLPPPEEWTEPEPVAQHIEREEINAFFVERGGGIVVAIYRASRRSEIWRGDGAHYPRPPFRSQVELLEFDASSGRLVRHTRHPELRVNRFQMRDWAGLLCMKNEILEIDWTAGRAVVLVKFDQPVASICQIGERVFFTRRTASSVVVGSFPRSKPAALAEHVVRGHRIASADVHGWGGEAMLKINESRLYPLDETGRPQHELLVRHYPYNAHCVGPVRLVHCDGHGANLYGFGREDGGLRWQAKSQYGWNGLYKLKPSGRVVGIRTDGQIDLFGTNGERIDAAALKGWAISLAAIGEQIIVCQWEGNEGTSVLGVLSIP